MLPPFFMPAEKRENCGASLCPVFPCERGEASFMDKRCALPLASPPRQKTFSRACPLSAIALRHQEKRLDDYNERSVSSIWL